MPCYTIEVDDKASNVVLIHAFKDYCALLFFKGALLKDAKGILIQQTESVQAARQLRFTDVREITKLKTTVKAYLQEAIAVEKAGLNVSMKAAAEFAMPEEFQTKLDASPALKLNLQNKSPLPHPRAISINHVVIKHHLLGHCKNINMVLAIATFEVRFTVDAVLSA